MTITQQPLENQLFAAYQPILFEVTEVNCPIMFCDVYISGIYYKSTSKTNGFSFDISDIMQEWHQKYVPPVGHPTLHPTNNVMNQVYVKFRSTYIDANGFTVSTYTAPIQGTLGVPPVSGTGESSEIFYSVNSTIQQDEEQNLITHLTSYKYGVWNALYFPLTHRPASCDIHLDQSDYWPFLTRESLGEVCLKLTYKLKGNPIPVVLTNCDILNPIIDFEWDKGTDAFLNVNLTGKINGTITLVDWGDGTTSIGLTHTYIEGSYRVRMYGYGVTEFSIYSSAGSPSAYGITEIHKLPPELETLNVGNNLLTSINIIQTLPALLYLNLQLNQVQYVNLSNNALLISLIANNNPLVSPINISTVSQLEYLDLDNCALTSITGFFNCTKLKYVHLKNNQLNFIGLIISNDDVELADYENNLLSISEVNNLLIYLDTNGIAIGIVKTINQSPTAPPSGLGLVAKNNLITKGWTVITD